MAEASSDQDTAAPQPQAPSGVRAQIDKVVAMLRVVASRVVVAATALLTLTLLVGFARELSDTRVVLQTIESPPELVAKGFTPTVAASRILEGISQLQATARTNWQGADIAPAERLEVRPDIELSGAKINVASLARYARQLLGIHKPSLSGDLTRDGDGFRLTLRADVEPARLETVTLTATDPNALLQAGAEAALRIIDPYTLAAALVGRMWEEAPPGPGIEQRETLDSRAAAVEEAIVYALRRMPRDDAAWVYTLWGHWLLIRNGGSNALSAIERFDAALRARPSFYLAHLGKADAFAKRGDDAAAEREHRAALVSNWRSAYSHHQYARFLGSKGRYEDALGQARQAVSLDPDDVQIRLTYAITLMRLGRRVEADRQFTAAAWLAPADPAVYFSWSVETQRATQQDRSADRAFAELLQQRARLQRLDNSRGRQP